jgi:hypothetical protein
MFCRAGREAQATAPVLRYEHTGLWVEFRFLPEHTVATAPEVTGELERLVLALGHLNLDERRASARLRAGETLYSRRAETPVLGPRRTWLARSVQTGMRVFSRGSICRTARLLSNFLRRDPQRPTSARCRKRSVRTTSMFVPPRVDRPSATLIDPPTLTANSEIHPAQSLKSIPDTDHSLSSCRHIHHRQFRVIKQHRSDKLPTQPADLHAGGSRRIPLLSH